MTLAELNRLRSADLLLSGDGLHVGDFARGHGITGKTVFRLLAFLKTAGYSSEVIQEGKGRTASYRHRYCKGVKPMFAKRK